MFSLILLPLLERSFDRGRNYTGKTNKNKVSVGEMDVYPFHMNLDIWVEAHNILGSAKSEHLQQDADWFGKLMLSVYNVDLCGGGDGNGDDDEICCSVSHNNTNIKLQSLSKTSCLKRHQQKHNANIYAHAASSNIEKENKQTHKNITGLEKKLTGVEIH